MSEKESISDLEFEEIKRILDEIFDLPSVLTLEESPEDRWREFLK